MPSPVAARRLEIFSAARMDPAGFLRFEPGRVRFSLGTSLADFALPVEVAPDASAIVRGAAAEVALLLATRHRAFVPADDLDRLILREDYAALPSVPSRLGSPDGNPDLRAAAQLAPALHPALTGGLVGAWMGKGGKGRSLVALWIGLLGEAFREMAATRGREETPLVVALALGGATAAAEREVRDALPGPPLDRYFRTAALAAMWLAARTGLARAWRDAGRSADDPLLAKLEAALAPGPLLGGRSGVLAGGVTLYGCELAAGVPRADELVARLAQRGDADAAIGDVAAALAGDDELARRAEVAVTHARLREALAQGVAAAEDAGGGEALEDLRRLLAAPGALAGATADDAARKGLARRLADLGAPLQAAEALVRAWRAKDPAAAAGLSRPAARSEYAVAAAALLCDVAVERGAQAARRTLSFRTGREAEGGAEAEWEAGRLYRLSARDGPILRAQEDRRAGHLFADVKDFTRRTGLLGGAAMAEFLRREFYLPIVTAAKEHFGGMGHLADHGGVALNNLLGDAISFTGRIEAMVALARAIRAEFAAYAARLSSAVSSDVVARQIAAIEEAHASGLAVARAARAEAEATVPRVPPGPRRAAAEARLLRARAEEARLAGERDRALARARGEVLEAGVFVSHGPAPLVVAIDDEVFGKNRVAIAEKINESARGTARVASARARDDAALARERLRRGAPGLAHAWSVFIGQPLQVTFPPEVEEQALRAMGARDLAGALRALAPAVRDALEAAAREPAERPGDIYNGGAALSEDALLAFLAAVEGDRVVRRVELAPERIPEPLRARWFFGDVPQSLVASFHPDGRPAELFRRVGVASFKGLGGVTVWELCAEDGGAGELQRALRGEWFRPR
ncbi:MAG TPA: hypothetical protein VM753_08970 [Anaeromyxobacter sp.]|nr:hypothetical protein [Anaeromyxobacter sp.]